MHKYPHSSGTRNMSGERSSNIEAGNRVCIQSDADPCTSSLKCIIRLTAIGMILIWFGCLSIGIGCEKQLGTSGPTTRTFDVSDRSFDLINWPKNEGDIWAVASPGAVKLLMPSGLQFAGTPLLLQFVKSNDVNGVVYLTEGMRFTDAFELALCYCKCYGIPTALLEQWKTSGGATGLRGAGEAGAHIGPVTLIIRITSQATPPKNFVVTLQFDWYRNKALEPPIPEEFKNLRVEGHPSTQACCQ